jgi:DNA-binding response OmpR family regulator
VKILIVEDDTVLASALESCLGMAAYTTDHISDGGLGARRIALNHTGYDVVILDLELPTMSGFEICKSIRENNIHIPILILTGRDALEDKVLALGFGADDYLTKPFAAAELVARIQALLRRPPIVESDMLTVGDLLLDVRRRKVFKDGEEVALSLKEFGILEYFMRRPNQVVERDQLLDHVWDFEFSSLSNVVDVHLHALRKKLGIKSELETIRGVGYRFNI